MLDLKEEPWLVALVVKAYAQLREPRIEPASKAVASVDSKVFRALKLPLRVRRVRVVAQTKHREEAPTVLDRRGEPMEKREA